MNERTASAAEEALFNDKINAAVSDLHAQRQITKWLRTGAQNGWEDDVTRRNGAIDRLLGLAKEEPESAPRIARMLSVYVKELSRDTEYPAKTSPQTDDPDVLQKWAQKLTFARSDMQNAVQVLGKLRKASGLPLDDGEIDLSETNLQRFDLKSLNFENVSFKAAQLQGAELLGAQLQGANLSGAQLQGANLIHAQLQGANLSGAQLQGADLSDAQFDSKTTLSAARFSYAALSVTDLSETSITHGQLSEAFGDATVILPDGKGPNDPEWPEHWSKEVLEWDEFNTQWRAFQKAGGFDPDNPN